MSYLKTTSLAILVVAGGWIIVQEQLAGASADATVNAPVTTLRAAIDGALSMEQRDLSAAVDNALYWYFMTLVWLPLAAIVFLSPYVR